MFAHVTLAQGTMSCTIMELTISTDDIFPCNTGPSYYVFYNNGAQHCSKQCLPQAESPTSEGLELGSSE